MTYKVKSGARQTSFAHLHRSGPANAIACLSKDKCLKIKKSKQVNLMYFYHLQPQCNCAWCGKEGSYFELFYVGFTTFK